MAIACPIRGDILKFSNSPWIIRPALIPQQLNLEKLVLINDFEAIGHAIANCQEDHLKHVCGPRRKESPQGITTVVGPGTGLGVLLLHSIQTNIPLFQVKADIPLMPLVTISKSVFYGT